MNDENESELFREAVQGIRPIKRSDRIAGGGPAPAPRPLQHEADERAALADMMDATVDRAMDTGEELSYRGEGIQDSVFRRLKRGAYFVGDELDLHGMRSDAAKLAVVQFLGRCQQRETRCVRIIHGKGLRSKGDGPVLKHRLDGWLRRRKDVLAFTSARPEHGGTGAVYVLLRKMSG